MATISLNIKTNLGSLSQEFDKVNTATKRSEKNFDQLAKELGQGSQAFGKLFGSATNAINAVRSYGSETQVARKQQSEYRKIINKLAKEGPKYKDQIKRLGQEYKDLAKATQRTVTGSKNFSENAEGLKGTLKGLGTTAFGVAAGIVAVRGAWSSISGFYSQAREFTKEIQNVTSITDDLSFEHIKTSILSINPILGSAKDLTAGLYQALSAGVEPAEALNFVAESAKFAKAALTDANTAVDVLTTALNSYGLSAKYAGSVSDLFFNTVKEGKTTGAELAANLGKVIPVFASMNIPLDQLLSGLAALTLQGVGTAEATTQLTSAVSSFLKPSTALSKALSEAGYASGAVLLETQGLTGALDFLQKATKGQKDKLTELLPDINATKAAMGLLINDGEALGGIMLSMADSTGATDKAFSRQVDVIDEMGSKWGRLNDTLGGIVEVIVYQMAPSIINVMDQISAALQNIDFKQVANTIVQGVTFMADVFSKFQPYITAVAVGLAALKISFLAFNAVANANPVVAVFSAIIIAVVALIRHWDDVKYATATAWEYMKKAAASGAKVILDVLDTLTSGLKKTVDLYNKVSPIKIPNVFEAFNKGANSADRIIKQADANMKALTETYKQSKTESDRAAMAAQGFAKQTEKIKDVDATINLNTEEATSDHGKLITSISQQVPTVSLDLKTDKAEEEKNKFLEGKRKRNFLIDLKIESEEAQREYESFVEAVGSVGETMAASVDQTLGSLTTAVNTAYQAVFELSEAVLTEFEDKGEQWGSILESVGELTRGVFSGITESMSENTEKQVGLLNSRRDSAISAIKEEERVRLEGLNAQLIAEEDTQRKIAAIKRGFSIQEQHANAVLAQQIDAIRDGELTAEQIHSQLITALRSAARIEETNESNKLAELKKQINLDETISETERIAQLDLVDQTFKINQSERVETLKQSIDTANSSERTLEQNTDDLINALEDESEQKQNTRIADEDEYKGKVAKADIARNLEIEEDKAKVSESTLKEIDKQTEHFAKEEDKVRVAQFKIEKDLAVAQLAILSTLAIAQAFAQLGPIGGGIAAGILIVAGLFQAANIINSKAPTRGSYPSIKRATGTIDDGFLVPPGYNDDNYNIGVRSGERVFVQNEAEQDSGTPIQITVMLDRQVLANAVQRASYNRQMIVRVR